MRVIIEHITPYHYLSNRYLRYKNTLGESEHQIWSYMKPLCYFLFQILKNNTHSLPLHMMGINPSKDYTEHSKYFFGQNTNTNIFGTYFSSKIQKKYFEHHIFDRIQIYIISMIS